MSLSILSQPTAALCIVLVCLHLPQHLLPPYRGSLRGGGSGNDPKIAFMDAIARRRLDKTSGLSVSNK